MLRRHCRDQEQRRYLLVSRPVFLSFPSRMFVALLWLRVPGEGGVATGSPAGLLYPAVPLQLYETYRSPSASFIITRVYTRSLDVTINYTTTAMHLLISRYITSFLGWSWSLTYHLQPGIFHPSTKANHRSGENSLCPPSSTTTTRGSWTSAF